MCFIYQGIVFLILKIVVGTLSSFSMVNRRFRFDFLVELSLFSVISFLISLLKIPVAFLVPMYKLDFGESVVLLGALYKGPLFGVLVAFSRAMLSVLLRGTRTLFLSEAIDFVLTSTLVFPCAFYIKKSLATIQRMVLGSFFAITIRVLCASLLNYYIILPVFSKIFSFSINDFLCKFNAVFPLISSLSDFITFFVAPFNFLKSIISCFVAFFLYYKLDNVNKKLKYKITC